MSCAEGLQEPVSGLPETAMAEQLTLVEAFMAVRCISAEVAVRVRQRRAFATTDGSQEIPVTTILCFSLLSLVIVQQISHKHSAFVALMRPMTLSFSIPLYFCFICFRSPLSQRTLQSQGNFQPANLFKAQTCSSQGCR